jgi:hypothetical protein
MPRHFYSIYGPSITEFLTLKRSLGFKYKSGEYELGKLDKIAHKRGKLKWYHQRTGRCCWDKGA